MQCCMCCYSLEQHYTNECPEGREYKICSECSNEEHVWHQYSKQNKKHVNCGGNHRTLAMKCPKRKEIIKNKRAQQNVKQNMTHSNITQSFKPPKMPTFNIPQVTKEEVLKIHICLAHAQIRKGQDHNYEVELNKVLKANNLPSITIPNENLAQSVEGAMSLPLAHEVTSTPQQGLSRQSSLSNLTARGEGATSKKLKACVLGLKFYTTKTSEWPSNFSTEDLVKGIRSKK